MTHHLGTWVSALADNQLGPAESERALAHVAGCASCAAELAAARQARRALSVVRDVEPGPDLTARLLALAAPSSAGSGTSGPGRHAPGRHAPVMPLGSSAYATPARALSGDLTRRRRPGYRFAAGSVAGLSAVAASLFVLGAQAWVVPSANPAQALSMLGAASDPGRTASGTWDPDLVTQISAAATSSASSSGETADAAVLDWMDRTGWACPLELPVGYQVTAARLIGDAGARLEVDLAGPDGRIVLIEERGQLDVRALAGAAALEVGGRSVYVLTRQPWHAVWQSGDTVVSIVSEASTESMAELVASFPAAGYDDGLPARLTRGWDTVTGAFAQP